MADKNEPRREMPRDLYPEWTTRPHSVQPGGRYAAIEEPPVKPRLEPPRRSSKTWVALLFLGVAVLAAFFLLGRERGARALRPIDGDSSVYAPDSQLEEVARGRLSREADLRDADVTLVVREQVVTVSGRVPDARTREKVLNVVRMTPNVTGVIDHLVVGAEKARGE